MTVYYNLVDDDGDVVSARIPYPEVLIRTGLKDQVGLAVLGWEEHHEPQVAFVFTDAIIATHIRYTRDSLLKNSDWTQTADSPLSVSKKAEWATYRQALRDMPADNTGIETNGFEPSDITWPTEPA